MIALLLLLSLLEPRPLVVDYPVSDDWPECTIGADFTVHSYAMPSSQMYFTKEFLTVDVGVYPKHMIDLTETGFSLVINHARRGIQAVNPAFVGGPRGIPNGQQSEDNSPGKIAKDAALPGGLVKKPTGGFLYFPYSGDAAKIKNVSLVYTLGNGTTRELVIR